MTLEELKVIISAETSKFRNALKNATADAKSSANTIEKQASKINRAISGIKSIIATAVTGFGLYKLGKEAIEVASDIQEVQNVVDVAFGDMAWKVERFSKTSIEQFGMSELSAKRTASTYMAMAKNMGLTDNTASDMAITLAGLTGDVASFYNISQELADIKLKSIFTGETETLKDLGVVMTQTNLKQFALSQGIKTDIKDMNQAQLTTLRYKYVLQQLGIAQGDFERTSGSWANQVRILKEQWKQLLGIIGNGLIAVFTPVIQVINTIIGKIITLANVVAEVFGKLFGKKEKQSSLSNVGKEASNASKSIGGVGKSLDGTVSKAKKAAKDIKGALSGFDDLNILSESSSSIDGNSGDSSGTGGGYDVGSIDWENKFPEPDTSGIDKAVDKVMNKLNEFKKFYENHKKSIASITAGLTAGILTFFGYKWLSKIGGLTGIFVKLLDIPGIQLITEGFLSVFRKIPFVFKGIFKNIISVISGSKFFGILKTAFAPITGFLSSALSTITGIVSSGLSVISGFFMTAFSTISATISSILACIMQMPIIGPILETIIGFVSSLVGWLGSLFSGITGVLGVIVSSPVLLATTVALIIAAIADLWMSSEEFRNNIIEAVSNIKEIVLNIWNNFIKPIFDAIVEICLYVFEYGLKPLWEAWKELVNVVITVIVNMWNNISPILNELLEFLGPIFKNVLDVLSKTVSVIFTAILNAITICISVASGVIEGFFSTIGEVFGGIKKIFNGIISFLTGVFTGNWKKAWEGMKSILNGIVQSFVGIVKMPINAIIGLINGFIGGLNKIKIPDWVPGVGGYGINIPKIPKLAQGGIANKATLGIFGEAGTEAIVPLKKNTQGLDMIADKILSRMPVSEGTGGGTYVINVVLESGERLTRMIIKNIKDYEIKTGKPVFDY